MGVDGKEPDVLARRLGTWAQIPPSKLDIRAAPPLSQHYTTLLLCKLLWLQLESITMSRE